MKYHGSYAKGLRTGRWTYYHEDGSLQAVGNHSEDRQDGPWLLGQVDHQWVAHGFFTFGIQNGLWVWFDRQTGAVKSFGVYVDGERVGPWARLNKRSAKHGSARPPSRCRRY